MTKRGKIVAILLPPPSEAAAVAGLQGFLRGAAILSESTDLTAPLAEVAFAAARGVIHS